MPEVTSAIPLPLTASSTTAQRSGEWDEPVDIGVGMSTSIAPSAADRDAILKSLYGERSRVMQARRTGAASANDEEYLAELNQYIDVWEAPESRASAKADVWAQLEALAASVLDVKAEIARHQK